MKLLLISLFICISFLFSQDKDREKENNQSEKPQKKIEQKSTIPKKSQSSSVRKISKKKSIQKKEAIKANTKNQSARTSNRRNKGRLSSISKTIETKVKIKRENEGKEQNTASIGRSNNGYGYGDAYLHDRNYGRYRSYSGFVGDIGDIIYVIDGRYPYSFDSIDDDGQFIYQYYSEYPYENDLFFKRSKDDGFPMMGRFEFINGNSATDEVKLSGYNLKIAYQFITMNIRYNSLTETIDGLSDRFNFLQIAPGLSYGVEQWNTLLHFYLGAGLLEIRSDYSDFERNFGGLNTGVEFKTFLPFNVSLAGSISYFALKDKTDDIEDLFNVIMTDINLTVHVYRFGIKAGMRSEQFTGFAESFQLSQPYFGLALYF